MSQYTSYTIGDFVNRPAEDLDFEILRFTEMAEPDVDDSHRHLFYEILWVEQGQSTQTIDHRKFRVDASMLFFIQPGHLHRFEAWQTLQGGSILFTEDFIGQYAGGPFWPLGPAFLDDLNAEPCLALDGPAFAEIVDTINRLDAEHKRPDRQQNICQAMLWTLLGQMERCRRAAPQHPQSRHLATYRKFRLLLDARYASGQSATFYADALAVTPEHLNKINKAATGLTTTQMLHNRQCLEAKRLLTQTSHPLAEIAEQVGFADASHLARIFKKATGYTPGEYRAKQA